MGIVSLLLSGSLVVAGIGAQSQRHNNEPPIQGSGHVKTETRGIGNFTKIRCDGVASVDATIGSRSDLRVTADDNLVKLITTKVEGDTLVIGLQHNIQTKNKITVQFSVPSLRAIEVKGASQVKLEHLRGGDFDTSIGGAGQIQASGSVDALTVKIEGAGNVNLRELSARSANVNVSGVGNASINTSGPLSATITGVGNVRYYGRPASVTKHVTGMGHVSAG